MIAGLLIGLGLYALAVAAWSVMVSGPYLGLALVIQTIPYGTIGLLGLLAGWLWRRGSRLGGPMALVWFLVTGAGVTYEFFGNWVPRLLAIGDPNVWYNWALPEVWIPVPLAIGLLLVLLMGAARLARRSSQRPAANG
ncbi:MAG: hypothetical protein ACXWWR_06955 [Candidatus Limnocylindrales bacterium]